MFNLVAEPANTPENQVKVSQLSVRETCFILYLLCIISVASPFSILQGLIEIFLQKNISKKNLELNKAAVDGISQKPWSKFRQKADIQLQLKTH